MKILLTGSHFTPAQAVIEELQKHPEVQLVYIGRNHSREGDNSPSVESRVIPKLGVKFIPITTGRLQRKFTIYTIPSLLKIPVGLVQSFILIAKEKPQAVISFGGYVSVPVVISSWLQRIPVIVHEQTLVSGLANQISHRFANKIAVTFDKEYHFNKRKIVVTGNPIRQEILFPEGKLSPKFAAFLKLAKNSHLPLILITGGNQGSHIINETVKNGLKELTEHFCIIHQTGDSKFNDFAVLSKAKDELPYSERYLPVQWIEAADLGQLLRQVDLVVSRAGINTLLELALVGVPVLLIPLPHVQRNEQNVNAQFFKDLKLAEVLDQDQLTSGNLLRALLNMAAHINRLKLLSGQARKIVISGSAQKLVKETLSLIS